MNSEQVATKCSCLLVAFVLLIFPANGGSLCRRGGSVAERSSAGDCVAAIALRAIYGAAPIYRAP